MNILFRELRANFKSLLIWSGIIILFNAVGYSKFSAFYENPDLLKVLDSMPPALLASFNMDGFNLTTVTGFYGLMVMYFSLILSISAAMWGSDIISKEERDRTVEFSLSLPIARSRLITAKLAAAAINCLLLLGVTWLVTILQAQAYHPDAGFYSYVAITQWAFLFLQATFLSLGILLGCAMKNHKHAGGTAVFILLGAYFTSVLSGLSDNLDFLRYLTPFEYFDSLRMLRLSGIELSSVLLSAAIILVALIGAYIVYSKRDLYI